MSKTFSQLKQELNEAPYVPTIHDPNWQSKNSTSDWGNVRDTKPKSGKTDPSMGDLSKKEVKSMSKGEPKVGRLTSNEINSPNKIGRVEPTINTAKNVAKSAVSTIKNTPPSIKSRAALSAAALAGSAYLGNKLNKIPAVSSVTDKIGKSIADTISKPKEIVRAKSPEVSVKPKATGPTRTVPSQTGGGLVTFPSSGKRASISQSDLGSALRGEPQTLKTPEVKADKTSPTKLAPPVQSTSSSSDSKPVTAGIKGGPNYPTKPKEIPVNIQKTSKTTATPKPVTKSPLPKEAPNKVTPKGKVTNEPMRKSSGGNPKVIPKGIAPKNSSNIAPKPAMKSIPTRKPSADPNAGGGFVTARAYGSKSAGITSTQNRFGGSKGQSFMKPTPQGRIKPAETQSQKDSRLASQGFKKM